MLVVPSHSDTNVGAMQPLADLLDGPGLSPHSWSGNHLDEHLVKNPQLGGFHWRDHGQHQQPLSCARRPTTRSAMKESSVSPERCETWAVPPMVVEAAKWLTG